MTQPPPLPSAPKRGFIRRLIRWAAIGFGLLIVLGVCGSLIGGDSEPDGDTAASATERAEATTTTAAIESASDTDPGSTVTEPSTTRPDSTTTPATTAAPTTTVPALPEGSFGDGLLVVGEDLQPGTYVSPTGSCYWARLAGFTGEFEEILANDNPSGQAIVTILPTDVGFESNGCGVWIPADAWSPDLKTEFGDGVFAVGTDIAPGLYEADGSNCYWQRMSGFTGEFDDLLANDNPSGHAVVEILPTDVGFASSRCGGWRPVEDTSEPVTEFGEGVWIVGVHIEPGLYEAPGGDGCYWQRMSGLSGEFGEIIANDLPGGPALVEIAPSDAGFASSRCGTWTKR